MRRAHRHSSPILRSDRPLASSPTRSTATSTAIAISSAAAKINRYLDGDRDIERRRALAAENLANARELLRGGSAKRADAMQAAGRALALDPQSKGAAELVSSLMVEAPVEKPAELVERLEHNETEQAKVRARKAITAVASLLSLSVIVLFLHVRNWTWLVAIWATLGSLLGVLWTTYKTGRIFGKTLLVYGVALAIMFSRIASPLVLMPTLMCGTLLPLSNIPRINDRPVLLYSWCVVVTILPTVLELVGVLPSTLSLGHGNFFELRSTIFSHDEKLGLYTLVGANALLLMMVGRFAIAIGRDRRDVQAKLTNQAWHLGKLLP